MTVMSTATKEFTINQLVTFAYRRAGLLNVYETIDEPRLSAGRDDLQLILHNLNKDGLYARCLDTTLVTFTPTVSVYLLTSAALDVQGNAQYIAASETNPFEADAERAIELISFERWHQLSNKSAAGPPTMFAVRRNAQYVEVTFWPVPDEAGYARVPIWRRLADVTNGGATVDLERTWAQYLVVTLARDLAMEAGLDQRVALLSSLSRELFPGLARSEAHHVPTQIVVNHPTGWQYR